MSIFNHAADGEKITDVFVTTGQPTITYVKRDNGIFENNLNRALDEKGQLCLLTGPSKTGKSTLYKNVLDQRKQQPLIVGCSKEMSTSDIWTRALEKLEVSRTETITSRFSASKQTEGETGISFGWKAIASLICRGKWTATATDTDEDVKKRVLANPSAETLIDALLQLNYVLVIEDFHYLSENTKVDLFQQWKRFTDSYISVIVVETSHRSVDIANSNKDLIGRITRIDVGNWDESDLEKICELGFRYLKKNFGKEIIKEIAQESVGLPIICQQVCLEIFSSKGLVYSTAAKKVKFNIKLKDLNLLFHSVAKARYHSPFESYYVTLTRGPREKARKYKTYELIILCFASNHVKFSLHRSEIDSRLQNLNVPALDKPPLPSITSALGALSKFQERRKIELLEWRQQDNTLYMLEPSFLFYIRWRRLSEEKPLQLEFSFENLTIVTK